MGARSDRRRKRRFATAGRWPTVRRRDERTPHPAPEAVVVGRARGDEGNPISLLEPLDRSVETIGRQAGSVVLLTQHARGSVDHDQRRRALGMGSGEEDGHRGALICSDDGCPLAANGVEDHSDVLRPLLERRQGAERHRIRDPGASLVEHDHPTERREPAEEAFDPGLLPHDLDVLDPWGHEENIDRAFAEHLESDLPLGPGGEQRLGIQGLGPHEVQAPLAGDALQLMCTAVVELDA